MQSLSCLALAFLQDDAGSMQHDVHLMMIGIWIIVIALVLAFLALAVAGLMALKLVRRFEGIADKIENKAWPLVDKTTVLFDELSPKVRTITTNVEQISYTVRGKIDEFSATASDINKTVKDVNARTQEKVSRVDNMVSEALNTAHHVSRTVQEGIRKPIQHVAGMVAGLKRGVETWAERNPFARQARRQTTEERIPYDEPVRAKAPIRTEEPTLVNESLRYQGAPVGSKRGTGFDL